MKVNVETGKWADFASNEKGGDLLSLYAAIHSLKQGEAAERLGLAGGANGSYSLKPRVKAAKIQPRPPKDPIPELVHPAHGRPSNKWPYRDSRGRTLFYVARYDFDRDPYTGEAPRKQIIPWTHQDGKWVAKGPPDPRPLYGLDFLASAPDKPVLVVEGEKAADAARQLVQDRYVVTTWPGGAQSVAKADWRPLKGREVVIWPDADDPGRKAAVGVYTELMLLCRSVSLVDVQGQPDGWDAADAMAQEANPSKWLDWLAGRLLAGVPEAELPPSKRLALLWAKIGLATYANGHPVPNLANAKAVLQNWPPLEGLVHYDEFTEKKVKVDGGQWADADTLDLTIRLQTELGFSRLGKEAVHDAVTAIAREKTVNGPRDWLEALPAWDGQPRVDRFFTNCMGAADDEYTRAVSKNFWVGLVARIYRPGCQLDNMVVLKGEQGIGKTKALRIIGGPWYAEASVPANNNEIYILLQGKWLVEIAELESFNRAEVTRVKQVITDTFDRYRKPYDVEALDHPRRCVFVGTTNDEEFLKDPTGGRRFWPVVCGAVDLDFIEASRDKLFAEAVALFKRGEDWYKVPELKAKEVQEQFRRVDEWESIVADYVQGKHNVRVRDIAVEALKMPLGSLDAKVQLRISTALRKSGWERRHVREGWMWQPKTMIRDEAEA